MPKLQQGIREFKRGIRSQSAKAKVKTLKRLMESAVQNIKQAGAIVANLLDENPSNFALIKEETGYSEALIERLQAVGQNRLHPELALKSSMGASMVMKLNMPLREQADLMANGAPIVSKRGDEFLVERKNLDSLTAREIARFADIESGTLRSPKEQESYLKETYTRRPVALKDRAKKAVRTRRSASERWRIENNSLVIFDNDGSVVTTIDKADVIRIAKILGS